MNIGLLSITRFAAELAESYELKVSKEIGLYLIEGTTVNQVEENAPFKLICIV